MSAEADPPAGGGPLPSQENTVVVVVVRNPGPGLAERAGRLGRQFRRVMVVDNGSSGQSGDMLDKLDREPGVRVEKLGENRGVAAALNRGIEMALEKDAAWALLMDQDTRPRDRLLEGLASVLAACPFRNRVAVVGANYVHRDTGLLGRLADAGEVWSEIPAVITAGSLHRLAAIREVGPFREDFFVDHVDHEYCLRARRAGWRIIAAAEPLMDQPVGDAAVHRLGGWTTTTSGHSPVRRYYMTRNLVLLARGHLRHEPRWILRALLDHIRRVGRLAVFEEDRGPKLRAVARGAADGLRGRTGRAPGGLIHEEGS